MNNITHIKILFIKGMYLKSIFVMGEIFMLKVLNRDLNEKNKEIRKRGYIPAVIYSHKLDESIPIEVYKTDFKRLLEANKQIETIELVLNGESKNCVLRDVQIDGTTDTFLHIDFMLL